MGQGGHSHFIGLGVPFCLACRIITTTTTTDIVVVVVVVVAVIIVTFIILILLLLLIRILIRDFTPLRASLHLLAPLSVHNLFQINEPCHFVMLRMTFRAAHLCCIQRPRLSTP